MTTDLKKKKKKKKIESKELIGHDRSESIKDNGKILKKNEKKKKKKWKETK